MATPEDEPPTDDKRLIAGRYRLDKEIGGGAMGTVWAGTDELLRRQVAVKEVRLPPGMPEEEAAEMRERALREARAIAVVTHSNVVTLYDVAREAGEPYVVMELVPSQSLGTLLGQHGALEEHQLALIADGVAAALEAAHRAGIVHRDVKPGNVLIGDAGRVKLTDFGISRNVSESTLTRTGIMLGTPAFIAPEIASGDPVTASADLWGLGATLFAAAEGRAPYDTDNDPLATVTSVVHDPVPVPTATGPIGEIITGLMVKEPSQRMSLQDVRRRLFRLLPETGSRPFDMLLDPDAPTVKVRKPAATAQAPRAAAPQPEAGSAPLASDPGPLPFLPRDPAPLPRRRSRIAVLSLVIAAVVVFTTAAVGGFAMSRTIAGAPLLPPTSKPAPPGAPAPNLVRWTDNAAHTSDNGGNGRFAIVAPEGWDAFHGERDDFTNSKSIHYVSPDGRGEIVVERFGGFYADSFNTDNYLEALPELAAGTRGRLTMQSDTEHHEGGTTTRNLVYNSVETGIVGTPGSQDMLRNTTARLLQHGNDLWIVRATVPQTDAARGTELFNSVITSFTPAL